MTRIIKTAVSEGIFHVDIPEASLSILCGCPADGVKHLMKRGIIRPREEGGVTFETGPNAILLSDVLIQNGRFSNLSEFPILQMFYRQGMIVPGHPNNRGVKPVLIGSRKQVQAQLEYIYRGNYGLISLEEIMAAGVPEDQAQEMMRLKLRFAFGKIARMDDFLDQVVVEGEPREIRDGVFIRRLALNHFEISCRDQAVTVDLNLPRDARYQPSYPLGFHQIRRDYFSVVHSGDGDGWDFNRPAMASIILFQGKVFLIDAGANVVHSLNALGIGVNEIAGIFHTHAHDDHFCGLATLMLSDHRIKYYATRLVRHSVFKKLAALSQCEEEEFEHYFEFNDLAPGEWNDLEGLEVRPVFSPHPVETTVLWFRTMDRDGYRTYAHFADIVGLKLLRDMITEDPQAPGVTREFAEAVTASYLEPADLKKLDIGGGMIHGHAEDFASDRSDKIILSHTALALTPRQKEIGSGAPFGMVDVLIPSHQEYVRSYAYHFLSSYFPSVPAHRLRVLLNNPLVRFNPESIILKAGEPASCILLLLTGQVEMIRTSARVFSILSAGGLMGDLTALTGQASRETYRAASFVQALRIPLDLYQHFVRRNGLFEEMTRLQELRAFLYATELFGDVLSCPRQNALAQAMDQRRLGAGEMVDAPSEAHLVMVREGRVELLLGGYPVETLGPGEYFGESQVLFDIPCLFRARMAQAGTLCLIARQHLEGVPVVRWKLLESYGRRLEKVVDPQDGCDTPFCWREDYGVGVGDMDRQHRGLFAAAGAVHQALARGAEPGEAAGLLAELVRLMEVHCQDEETLMQSHGYPGCEAHRRRHERLLAEVRALDIRRTRGRPALTSDFVTLLKDWVVTHILTEDRKYGPFFRRKGLS